MAVDHFLAKCTSWLLGLLRYELYDVLNKLLRNDEENGSGDVQMLCELFSGEKTSYRFATEKTREIPGNIPFGMLGTTQMPFERRTSYKTWLHIYGIQQ